MQHSSDLISIVDADSTIRVVSPSAHPVLGYEPRQLVGTRLLDRLHPDDAAGAAQFRTELARLPARGSRSALSREWRLVHVNGQWLTMDIVGTNLLDEPTVQGLVLNTRDVTERRVMEAPYMHQAFHDSLRASPRPTWCSRSPSVFSCSTSTSRSND